MAYYKRPYSQSTRYMHIFIMPTTFEQGYEKIIHLTTVGVLITQPLYPILYQKICPKLQSLKCRNHVKTKFSPSKSHMHIFVISTLFSKV